MKKYFDRKIHQRFQIRYEYVDHYDATKGCDVPLSQGREDMYYSLYGIDSNSI